MKHARHITFAIGILTAVSTAQAHGPGTGLTAEFEKQYLRFIIDHHYSALRMTELAAGTDHKRSPEIGEMEGTSPTPQTRPVAAKANSQEIKSIARQANRAQREEIMEAQRMLRNWYGESHSPRVAPEGQQGIDLLQRTTPGKQFDHIFLEVFSRHHYRALQPSLSCLVSSDVHHDMLHRYCNGIVHSQVMQIQNMRSMLAHDFGIKDYQPIEGIKGRHSGSGGQSSR